MIMKRKVVNKLLAAALSATMVFGLAACGGNGTDDGGQDPNVTTPTNTAGTPAQTGTNDGSTGTGSTQTGSTEANTGVQKVTGSITKDAISKLSIKLPVDVDHETPNAAYDRLVKEINEKTGVEITWSWEPGATYYSTNETNIATDNVHEDVLRFSNTPSTNAVFTSAAEDGLFWDLTPYIDDAENYPNLAAMTAVQRASLSYFGKIYALPLARNNTAREGMCYRLDWFNNLNLDVDPTTIEGFEEMIRAFTEDDPDGNGVDDTIGLAMDGYQPMWDFMALWFGAPNEWGIDDNGDLIPAFLTDEYKKALDKFRDWYAAGYINSGANGITKFTDIAGGRGKQELMDTGIGGVYVQCLDTLRKIETGFESAEPDLDYTDPENLKIQLEGYVSTGLEGFDGSGNGAYCRPFGGGLGGFIAITTVNIKTEEQLRRALQVVDQLSEGWFHDLFTWGWVNETYYMEDDGYPTAYTANTTPTINDAYGAEIGNQWGQGFNQVETFNYAPGHEPMATRPVTSAIQKREQELYAADVPYCVPNYANGYTSETYVKRGTFLDSLWKSAVINYITDQSFDEGRLLEAFDTWKDAGGQTVIDELNEQYHAAGN